jgi:hypothetical protein
MCQICIRKQVVATVRPQGKKCVYDMCEKCARKHLPSNRVDEIMVRYHADRLLARSRSIEAAHKAYANRGPRTFAGMQHMRFGDFFSFGGGGTGMRCTA